MTAAALLLLILSSLPFGSGTSQGVIRTGGDHPPDLPVTFTGSFDVAFAIASGPAYGYSAFALDGIPEGSSVHRAFVVTGYWSSNEPGSQGVESISLNGRRIQCCDVFDANAASYASYFDLSVQAQPGENEVSIWTGSDWLAWHIVGLVTNAGPVPVRPGSWSRLKSLYR